MSRRESPASPRDSDGDSHTGGIGADADSLTVGFKPKNTVRAEVEAATPTEDANGVWFRERNSTFCYPIFLPFEGHTFNRVDALRVVTRYLDRQPPTSQSFTRGNIASRRGLDDDLDGISLKELKGRDGVVSGGTSGGSSGVFPPLIFILHGAYPTAKVSRQTYRFANPEYVHQGTLPDCTDPATRRDWLRLYALLGLPEQADVAPHFGVSETRIQQIIYQQDIPWTEYKQIGKLKMGRTWRILRDWCDITSAEVGELFGTNEHVVKRWTADAKFEVPDPPRDVTPSV